MCIYFTWKKIRKCKKAKNILKSHTLKKIIKLPEKTFSEGVTTSIFIFEAGIPQNNTEIFACYIEDDGLETVKNQGRQDIKNRWPQIESKWIEIITKQSGDSSCQWIKPSEHLSYQVPVKETELFESDFSKTMTEYLMYKQQIDVKELKDRLYEKIMYKSSIEKKSKDYSITIEGK